MNLIDSTANGDFLSPDKNPYLKSTFDAAAQRMSDAYARGTASNTMAQFNANGAYGGSAMNEAMQANQQTLGDSLGNLSAQIYGGAYENERNRQQQAAGLQQQGQMFDKTAAVDLSKFNQTASMQQDQFNRNLANNQDQFNRSLSSGNSQFAQNLAYQNSLNQSNSTANWLGAGIGLLGTAGSIKTNNGSSNLLSDAWSGIKNLWGN